MLARTADNLFWLARSMERADFTARTIEATLRLEILPRNRRPRTRRSNGRARSTSVGALDAFHASSRRSSTSASAIDFLTFDRSNPSSICNCLENARANGRAVRTALTVGDLDGDQRRLAGAQALRGDAPRRDAISTARRWPASSTT